MNKFFQPESERLTVTERYRVARAMIREAYLTPDQLLNLESYDIPPETCRCVGTVHGSDRRRRRQPSKPIVVIDETTLGVPGRTAPPAITWRTTTIGAPRGHHFVIFGLR